MSTSSGAFSSQSGGQAAPGSESEQNPTDPPTDADEAGGSQGTPVNQPDGGFDGILGIKDATAGIANFGPDGGRPEVAEHPEPLPEPGPGADGGPGVMAEPEPSQPAEPTDPVDPLGPPAAITGERTTSDNADLSD